MTNVLDIAVSISGDLGLDLLPEDGYQVVACGPGGRVWRKQTTQSPFRHGRTVVGQVLETATMPLIVLVKADTHSVLAERIVAMINAVEQTDYTITAVIEGVTWTWQCETADTAIGDSGSLDPHRLRSVQQLVTCSVPRHPVPLAGPS